MTLTTADLPVTMQADPNRPHQCDRPDCGGHNAPVQTSPGGVASGR